MEGSQRVPKRTVPLRIGPILLLLWLVPVSFLRADIEGEYHLEFLADGTPRFTQVLRWEPDPNVSLYRVIVQNESGEIVVDTRTERSELNLCLEPGAYRVRIVLFNLLGKPEFELPWKSFTVKQARTPRIRSASPKTWYLEEPSPVLVLSGQDLVPGATVELTLPTNDSVRLKGEVIEHAGTSRIRVVFPSDVVRSGTYTLTITNPGGLSTVLPGAIVVKYRRPVDVQISAGFSPWVSLYDSWYTRTWPGTVFPASAVCRWTVHFMKTDHGHFGGELTAGGRFMSGGTEGAEIRLLFGSAGLNAVYRLLLSKTLNANLRAGGSVMMSFLSFEYDGTEGATLISLDPGISAGLSLSYRLSRNVFLEAGADWSQIFASEYTGGGVMPFIAAGYTF